jgi:hypothetical protein
VQTPVDFFLEGQNEEVTRVLPCQIGVILCQCGNNVLHVWLIIKINETGKAVLHSIAHNITKKFL